MDGNGRGGDRLSVHGDWQITKLAWRKAELFRRAGDVARRGGARISPRRAYLRLRGLPVPQAETELAPQCWR
jgi:hypothetical protein